MLGPSASYYMQSWKEDYHLILSQAPGERALRVIGSQDVSGSGCGMRMRRASGTAPKGKSWKARERLWRDCWRGRGVGGLWKRCKRRNGLKLGCRFLGVYTLERRIATHRVGFFFWMRCCSMIPCMTCTSIRTVSFGIYFQRGFWGR